MIALEHSEHTRDFRKPVTVAALAGFDPELSLVFNKRHECFQVMRERKRIRSFGVEGFGTLHAFDSDLIYVTDWTEGLLGSDDPWPMINHMIERDMIRNPMLERDLREKVQANIERQNARVRDNYRHAFRSNRRQLLKAWEPIFNFGVNPR